MNPDGQPRRDPAITMYLSAASLGLGSSINVGLLLMMSSKECSQTILPLLTSILWSLRSKAPHRR